MAMATVITARPRSSVATLRHPKNKTRYRSLDKIAADSRVVEIWDEGEDGIWVQLADGWNWDDVSCVHEWRVRDVLRAFRDIKEGPVL